MSYLPVCVLHSATTQDLSQSETRSSSHNSPSHERKLPDITFVFLAGLHVPLRASSPESPAVTAVVIFPAPMGSSALLPLQTKLRLPTMRSHVSPSIGIWGQVPADTGSSSKIEKNSFILNPQPWYVHTTLQGHFKNPGKSVKDEKKSCTFLHGLMDR